MTTGVVTFDPAAFQAAFPEFATLTQGQCEAQFALATLYLDNSVNSRVQQIENRAPLLNLLTAHLCKLNCGANGAAPSQLVGRISTATEGSVTVGTEMPDQPRGAAWYQQTKYGAQYWTASARWRQARFVPGCVPPAPGPAFPQGYGGWLWTGQ